MTQYCRYCQFVNVNFGCYRCQKSGKNLYRPGMKHTNRCKDFQYNPVDVLRENTRSHKPTGRKITQFGGLGEQIKMEELF